MSEKQCPTLLVFGDSLAYFGPDGARPADDPRLWPNVAARLLDGWCELFAGIGWTARDAWWSLTSDPRVWPVMRRVDVLVLAVGNMDTLPSPLPSYLRVGIRYLRPAPVRRVVRRGYLAAQPWLSRLLHGRPVALPPALSVAYLDRCLSGVRSLRPDLPAVAVLPPVHHAASYGYVHTGYAPARAAISEWAARRAVPVLDLAEVVREHVLGGHGNPDGMHWGWAGHELVGAAFAELIAGLNGVSDSSGAPERLAGDRT
ncbi:MAG: diglucosylglycerate octanoyltransferase [Sciscionella sp.]